MAMVQWVAELGETLILERPDVQLVADPARRRHGECQGDAGMRRHRRTAEQPRGRDRTRAALHDRRAEALLVVLHSERRGEEVLRLDTGPLERPVQDLALPRLD